jgi:ribosome-associated toxin RatA of RatAB toxin-antitoxin module
MKSKHWPLVLAIFGAMIPCAASASHDVVVKTVEVDGSDVPKLVVTATMDAPPEKVWAIVSDCAHYKEHMPRIAASKLLSKSGNTRTCEVTVEMPFPLSNLTSVTQAVHEESPAKYSRKWKLVRGDFKINEGSWEVSPANAARTKSSVRYTLHAEPNTAVPQWIREKAQKKTLPEMIDRVELEAQKLP